MPDMTHITVTAPAERVTPIHKRDGGTVTGAQPQVIAGEIHRVRYSQDVRRAIGRGDLVPCDMNGAPCGVELAAAPDEIDGYKIAIPAKRFADTIAEQLTPERSAALGDAIGATKPKKGT